MAWNKQYWDTVSNFYWNPRYIGLQGHKLNKFLGDKDNVFVPRKLLNPAGPIYTRTKTKNFEHLCEKLRAEEEVLNHAFNFMFSIAPDLLIEKLFCSGLSFEDDGPFEFFGFRELSVKFGLEHKGVGQHDALLASFESFIAIELKTGALSSPDQLLKYVLLLARLLKDRPETSNFGLLFICPEADQGKMLPSCGLSRPNIASDWLEIHKRSAKKDVRTELDKLPKQVRKVLERLTIATLSWTRLHSDLCEVREQLKPGRPSQQAMRRLLEGFIDMLGEQARTGIPREQVEAARPPFLNVMDIRAWAARLENGSELSPDDRRKALVAFVSTTTWGGPSVIRVCWWCPLDELEKFVHALKNKGEPISLGFRWAADGDMGGGLW